MSVYSVQYQGVSSRGRVRSLKFGRDFVLGLLALEQALRLSQNKKQDLRTCAFAYVLASIHATRGFI